MDYDSFIQYVLENIFPMNFFGCELESNIYSFLDNFHVCYVLQEWIDCEGAIALLINNT